MLISKLDPGVFEGRDVLVVGGGDSALEAAIALATSGAHVTLSYRKREFARPKPENVGKLQTLVARGNAPPNEQLPAHANGTAAASSMRDGKPAGTVALAMETTVLKVERESVALRDVEGKQLQLPNDFVFTMLGREAPLDFFRRSALPIRGEWSGKTWAAFLAFFAFCWFLYLWKATGTPPRRGVFRSDTGYLQTTACPITHTPSPFVSQAGNVTV